MASTKKVTSQVSITRKELKQYQKLMAEKLLEASKDRITRNIKDSVFCDLFSDPKYLFQLYQVLHPEDTDAEPNDLTIITLSRIIAQVMYNDLGFLVGNRLIVLVEAQSTWTENILIRFLEYLGETYRRYIEKNGLNIYSEKKIQLPKPELYVIYTGERENRPDKISLRHSFFGGEDCCVDVEAKIIYDSEQGDILNQFITFSKVFDKQRELYPDDQRKAVQETIRICKDKDVLTEYLSREEAAAVMFTFADQETATRLEREECISIGEARGETRGEIKGAIKLYNDEMNLSPLDIIQKIMKRFSLKEEDAKQYTYETLGLQPA